MIKKWLINLGNVVAVFLMFAPIYIIYHYKDINNYLFYLICFILYDIYLYRIICFDNFMKKQKKLYDNIKTEKAIESRTREQKDKWFQVIGITTIEEYFKNK